MRVIIIGASGKMGKLSCKAIDNDKSLYLAGKAEIHEDLVKLIEKKKPHIMVDFTSPKSVMRNAKIIVAHNIHPIIGTSGLSIREINNLTKICKIKKLGAIIAPNFSISTNLMMMFIKNVYQAITVV